MKTLVFSDTHLTHAFDPAKFEFLEKIIHSADQVIINGDFWDSDFTDFDRFCRSKWNRLFPLLLEKQTKYVHGNHDPKEKTDEKVRLLSIEDCDEYLLKADDQSFSIQHGDKFLNNRRIWILNMYYRILYKTESTSLGLMLRRLIHFFEWMGYTILGSSFMTNTATSRHNNELMKKHGRRESWLICGESHYPELDTTHKYANSGCIRYGSATYLMITDGDIKLCKEKY